MVYEFVDERGRVYDTMPTYVDGIPTNPYGRALAVALKYNLRNVTVALRCVDLT